MLTTNPPRPASPGQLAWLDSEIRSWRLDGLITEDQAVAIRSSYVSTRRFTLTRLALGLGGVFVGIGLIWLVAANLDQLSPLVRFVLITAIWIGIVIAGEMAAAGRRDGGSLPSPLVGALRLIGALGLGAVVFQAAQSLHVPAYEPALLGWWAVGAGCLAYLTRSTAALTVTVLVASGYAVWASIESLPSATGFVLGVGAAAVLATAVASLHSRFGWGDPAFRATWREPAAALGLVALFASAIPDLGMLEWQATPWLITVVVIAVVAVAASSVLARGLDRWEPLAMAAVALAALALLAWETDADVTAIGVQDWAHAVISVIVFVGAATWVAALGALRDSPRLTAIALLALVVFTTFQAFAIFAPIIDGAWLFLVLGLVFLGTGFGFDRARRHLAETLDDDRTTAPDDAATEEES